MNTACRWLSDSQRMLFVVVLLLAVPMGVPKSRPAVESSGRDYNRANDPAVFVRERIQAASRLSEQQRTLLRAELTAQLPGEWDLATFNAIQVLGAVGDSETISALRN